MKIKYHLPGLFEFYSFYEKFLSIYFEYPEYFYEWFDIGSIYGAPSDCIWGGGRMGAGKCEDIYEVLKLVNGFGISARLTFSNSLLKAEHLSDTKCNNICKILNSESEIQNGIIVHSDLLLDYLYRQYKKLYFVSSTTKVLVSFDDFHEECRRSEFKYVVPDFRLNKSFDNLKQMLQNEKDKVEFLCNEGCFIGCADRKECYENVSRIILGDTCYDYKCSAPKAARGYLFSDAMKNPSFISREDIVNWYLPLGFTNFKIEGRNLGSALILEILMYYMVKPDYQLLVREKIYLDSMLDLF